MSKQAHKHNTLLALGLLLSSPSNVLANLHIFISSGRSRKKRATNTIDSINPSRAPVGFLLTCPESDSSGDGNCKCPLGHQCEPTTEPRDIDSPFENLSVNPLIGEDQARIRSFSSNCTRPTESSPNDSLKLGQRFLYAPTPLRHNSRDLTSFVQKQTLTPNTARVTPLSCPKHRPHSAGATLLSKDILTGRNVPGEVPDLPLPMYNTRPTQHPNMAPSGPSFGSQARAAELNAAAAARARHFGREIGDANNLPSSKPISHSTAAAKAHSRSNKGTKTWKPFNFEGAQEAFTPGILAGSNHRSMNPNLLAPGPHRFDPSNPNIAPHPLRSVTDMESNDIREHRNIPTGPARMRTPYWLHEMNSHLQPNMLSSPGYYEPVQENSFSPHHHQPASVPSPKAFVNLRGPPLLGPDDLSPAKQEEKSALRSAQNGTVSQNPLHEDPFMPGHPHHPYGPSPLSFTPQPDLHVAYGYGPPVYSPRSAQADMDYHFTPQGAQDENDQYIAYAPAPPLAPQFVDPSEQPFDIPAIDSTVHTEIVPRVKSPIRPVPFKSVNSLIGAETKALQLLKSQPKAEDTKREITAYLNSVVEASKADLEKNTEWEGASNSKDRRPKLAESHRAPIKPQGGLFFPHVDFSSLPSQQPTDVLACDESTRQQALAEATLETALGKCPRIDVKGKRFPTPDKIESMLSVPMPGKFDIPTNDETTSTFRFPPPGLPFPKNMGPISSLETRYEPKPPPGSRLEQSNFWFHADNRGEQRDRLRIANITNQDSLRRETARGFGLVTKDDTLADTSNVLLGGVLVSLKSYLAGDPRAQFGNFANFGEVPDSACEPSNGGNRSFFDYDPSGSWGFPPSVSEHRYQYRMNGKGADEARFPNGNTS